MPQRPTRAASHQCIRAATRAFLEGLSSVEQGLNPFRQASRWGGECARHRPVARRANGERHFRTDAENGRRALATCTFLRLGRGGYENRHGSRDYGDVVAGRTLQRTTLGCFKLEQARDSVWHSSTARLCWPSLPPPQTCQSFLPVPYSPDYPRPVSTLRSERLSRQQRCLHRSHDHLHPVSDESSQYMEAVTEQLSTQLSERLNRHKMALSHVSLSKAAIRIGPVAETCGIEKVYLDSKRQGSTSTARCICGESRDTSNDAHREMTQSALASEAARSDVSRAPDPEASGRTHTKSSELQTVNDPSVHTTKGNSRRVYLSTVN